ALALDPRHPGALYLIAARWVFAPRPFNNFNRGVEMMRAILEQDNLNKDDVFNASSAIGWAMIQQRRFSEAQPWLLRALAIYPTNRFVQGLLAEANAGVGTRGAR
ncbi:MAG: hypothetical protein FWE09_04260, partial [Treponema sp.]|nr:hypothetical protein [Treponema sp.]